VTTAALDDFLVRYAPGPRIAISPAVASARSGLERAVSTLQRVPDAALGQPWPQWGAEGDVRYGFYRILEVFEAASADAAAALRRAESASGKTRAPSGDLTALATAARWELHGRLATLDDALLDRDPGGGEWNVRQTVAHVINGQRAYGWYTAYWLAQGVTDANALPPKVPTEVASELPDEATEGTGGLGEIRARLDGILDASTEVLGALNDQELAVGARWMGNPVTIGFRIGRWSSHIQEHTVQVDKTLAAVGWQPREVDRLIGLIYGAYGRLEAEVFAVPAELLEMADESGRTALGIVGEAVDAAEGHAHEVAGTASVAAVVSPRA